ncbi:MAG: 5'-methylthioadenosine/S-adenosylhomocysteine nucleosidase [Clostridia bacterium]|nr:5'-methylthioadenosine/S-adenosylhomocysteine nucleosidase [Clostridia bacterium]
MICFVIAMDKEADPIIREMRVESDEKAGNKRILRGQLYNLPVAVVICGVGKVNAASGAQYAIDILHADKIVNIGVAGGLNEDCAVGKIYAISHAVQYDFDLTQLNGGEIGTLDECEENYIRIPATTAYPLRKLATGDRFNDSKEDYKLLTEILKADIRDMEGGAIAQVCMHAGVPFRSYKIISDLAGSGSTTEQYLSNLNVCFKTMSRELENVVNEVK